MVVDTVHEPARAVPVVETADLCVVGGSCTGVFAAVRAARLGLRVVLVEKTNAFGGVATNGLVNIWHSTLDTEYKTSIIEGLTMEMVVRLEERDAVERRHNDPNAGYVLNTEELKIELDELVREHGVVPYLHAAYAGVVREGGRIEAVLLETKDGRVAVRAKVFVDATGDGDVAAHAGVPFGVDGHLQPPSTCAKIRGLEGLDIRALIREHREEFGLEADAGWNGSIPGGGDVRMHADTHVFHVNAADAGALTAAEMDGRRKVRAVMDMVRKYHPGRKDALCLLALSSYIGIRETRRFHTECILTEEDVLHGRPFDDAIAHGSYRVDVHYPEGGGFLFKYLDGSQISITAEGREPGRWRPETDTNPTYYSIPYRTMVHRDTPNLILAGRMIGTDKGAFGAYRVMVNCNQTGEAAGVAAYLAIREACHVLDVKPDALRGLLIEGGSRLLP